MKRQYLETETPKTCRQVEKHLAAHGITTTLRRAKDYLYFAGDTEAGWNESGVYVPRVSSLTFGEWLSEYQSRQACNVDVIFKTPAIYAKQPTPNDPQSTPAPAGGRRHPGEVERLRVEMVATDGDLVTFKPVDWRGIKAMTVPAAVVRDLGATEDVLRDNPPEYFKSRWKGTRTVEVDRDTFYDLIQAELFGRKDR